jgi:hypothetical protein
VVRRSPPPFKTGETSNKRARVWIVCDGPLCFAGHIYNFYMATCDKGRLRLGDRALRSCRQSRSVEILLLYRLAKPRDTRRLDRYQHRLLIVHPLLPRRPRDGGSSLCNDDAVGGLLHLRM